MTDVTTNEPDTFVAPPGPGDSTMAKKLEWLPAKHLRVDPTYQRPLDNVRVKRMGQQFDPDALGTLEISQREDGSYWVIDGQHRLAAIHIIGYGDQTLPCLVHRGLTVKDEARIFRLRNTATKPNSLALFRAELAEGGAEARDIDNIVRRVGLTIQNGGAMNTIQAVSAMRRVYKNGSPLILERTLRLIQAAWGGAASNFQADMIVGLAIVMKRYPDLDRERLRTVLSGIKPILLLSNARASKASVIGGGGGLWASALPEQIVALYNKGLRTNKLPDWERRTDGRQLWK